MVVVMDVERHWQIHHPFLVQKDLSKQGGKQVP